MRKALLALVIATLAGVTHASIIDDIAVGYSPRTGDVWVDARLGDVNVFASGNRDGFVDEVVVSTGAPRSYLVGLLDRGWAPGDVYYACLIAQQLGRSCDYVVGEYQRERDRGGGQGWGALAQRLGIRPGSSEFHALKNGVGQGNERMRGRGRGHERGGPPQERGGPPDGRGNGRGNGKGNGNGRGGG